ncbi:MAG: hypothetical protein MI861_17030 [Pirellulales bacterium]|nr:hypothetical protein [Pirellulales bacterium]
MNPYKPPQTVQDPNPPPAERRRKRAAAILLLVGASLLYFFERSQSMYLAVTVPGVALAAVLFAFSSRPNQV